MRGHARTTGQRHGRPGHRRRRTPSCRLPVPEPEAVVARTTRSSTTSRSRLLDRGKTVDARRLATSACARSALPKGADGKLRIALNGKILFNLATLDQGFWPDGLNTAPTDAALQVRPRAAQGARLQHGPQAHQGRAGPLVLLGRQARPDGVAGHARRRRPTRCPSQWRDQFEAELHEMVERAPELHRRSSSWVPFNEGWGEWDRAETGRIADTVKAQDPSRLVNAHSGVNCCNSKGDSGRGDVIDFHAVPRPGAPRRPTATGSSVDGEHGGFGLKMPDHMWFGDGGAYEMTPDSATLTRQVRREPAATCSRSAQYLRDQRLGLHPDHRRRGRAQRLLHLRPRRSPKMDFAQVRTINQQIIAGADGTGDRQRPHPPPGTPGPDGHRLLPARRHHAKMPSATTTRRWSAARPCDAGQERPRRCAERIRPVRRHRRARCSTRSGNYTAAAWVKLNKADGAFQTVVSQDGDRDSDFFLQYSGAGPAVRDELRRRPGARRRPSRTRASWYHLTGVRDVGQG